MCGCKRAFVPAFIAAIVMFVWVMASWMVLPWHKTTFRQFKDRDAVIQVLNDNAPKSGVYALPGMDEKHMQADKEAKRKVPIAFMSIYKPGVSGSMLTNMATEFATSFFILLVITMLLLKTNNLGFFCRVMFVFAIGVVNTVAANVPMWNWWHFANDFTLVAMAEHLIGMFVAAIIIASMVRTNQTD